jgi:CheY-like chemotaxis protein
VGEVTGRLEVSSALAPARVQWFPAQEASGGWTPAERAVLAGRQLRGEGERTHVLMIEDDPAIGEMYRLQLEHDGYAVTIATTAEIGFASLSDHPPDIVLLDLLLPDRSGFEALSYLNDRFPNHPPVVILSNYGEPSMIDRGRALGAVEYLVKSRVTPGEVSGQIPTWIEQTRRGGQPDS